MGRKFVGSLVKGNMHQQQQQRQFGGRGFSRSTPMHSKWNQQSAEKEEDDDDNDGQEQKKAFVSMAVRIFLLLLVPPA